MLLYQKAIPKDFNLYFDAEEVSLILQAIENKQKLPELIKFISNRLSKHAGHENNLPFEGIGDICTVFEQAILGSKEDPKNGIEKYLNEPIDQYAESVVANAAHFPYSHFHDVELRNQQWCNPEYKYSIHAYHARETTCLVAVGAAHLHGDKGILRILNDQGYAIRLVEELGLAKRIKHVLR